MPVGFPRLARRALAALGALGAALTLAARPAAAQLPQPIMPDTVERSGLIQRFTPIESTLPSDPRRDNWYNTRFGDRPHGHRPNSVKEGGLYGHPWRANCTRSIYPFFYGSPGQDSIGPECCRWHPWLRYPQGFLKPFKPVGMYYDQGSYVPVLDLDPLVPGPGPYPWPFYLACPRGG
jgi:hypothetical protein